jgi:hypothetical protein
MNAEQMFVGVAFVLGPWVAALLWLRDVKRNERLRCQTRLLSVGLRAPSEEAEFWLRAARTLNETKEA